jgi:hypothetical protein
MNPEINDNNFQPVLLSKSELHLYLAISMYQNRLNIKSKIV